MLLLDIIKNFQNTSVALYIKIKFKAKIIQKIEISIIIQLLANFHKFLQILITLLLTKNNNKHSLKF